MVEKMVISPMVMESEISENSSENVPERGHWTGRFDYILAALGGVVGLGNIWRFPYLCYKNGGGAFVLVYVIMVSLIGMPVYFLEVTLGQYSAMGPSKVFGSIAPIFKGVGYTMVFSSSVFAIYYSMIIGWTLFYFFNSFRSDMQWQYCHHDFNTDNCFNDVDYHACKASNVSNVFNFRTCYNSSYAALNNLTDIPENERVSAPEEYFNHHVLGKSDSFEDYGTIRWPLMVCLLGVWVIAALSQFKGIKSMGKVVYFTATFPYALLTILLIRGVTLQGAGDGIYFYLVPDFTKLMQVQMWQDAATQVVYSIGLAGGAIITYASYNKFHNNLIRDVLTVVIIDTLTSLFAGFVVFSMLGFMANQLHKSVHDVVDSGTGLAFIAYPNAITRMPVATAWALLFFFMLFLLGIDSVFANVENMITFISDQYPSSRNRKPVLVCIIVGIYFLLGLPFTTNGGIYLLQVVDTYGAAWPRLVSILMELCAVAYVYGMNQLMENLYDMTGWSPSTWIRSHLFVTIMTVSPLITGVILLMSWIDFKPPVLGNYVFPTWANAIGWVTVILLVSFIPVVALLKICQKHKDLSWLERIQELTKPTEEWRANAKANISGKITKANSPAITESTPICNSSHLQ